MRCLNCHTVLAANDTRCVSCGAATQLKRAIDAGVLVTPQQYRKKKRMNAIAITLFGLVLVGAGAAVYPSPAKEGEPAGPRKVTADDLLKLSQVPPNPWVEYTPDQVHDTGLKIVSGRPGRRQTTTRFLLAPVGDRFLLTEVKAGFTGVRLEGQLQVSDSPMYRDLLAKVRREFPDKAGRLLPYQLNCENTYAGQSRTNSMVGMGLAGFGALCFFCGVAGFFVRPKPA